MIAGMFAIDMVGRDIDRQPRIFFRLDQPRRAIEHLRIGVGRGHRIGMIGAKAGRARFQAGALGVDGFAITPQPR